MTFDELERSLPNGFHDAEVSRIAIDYCAGSLVLNADFWIGDLDASEPARREERRHGVLTVDGLVFCAIEAPDPGVPLVAGGGPVTASGDSPDSNSGPSQGRLIARLPPGTSCYRLFISEWNAFIYIAARTVRLEWEDG